MDTDEGVMDTDEFIRRVERVRALVIVAQEASRRDDEARQAYQQASDNLRDARAAMYEFVESQVDPEGARA